MLSVAPMANIATAPTDLYLIQEKVVYHVNDSDSAAAEMRNMKNQIAVSPDAKIIVVTHSNGIDFLLSGATDKNGNP